MTASLFGIGTALLCGKTVNRDPEQPGAIPFGPAIAVAAMVCVLWAEPVSAWYLSLF